jgi:hypothetical protein
MDLISAFIGGGAVKPTMPPATPISAKGKGSGV